MVTQRTAGTPVSDRDVGPAAAARLLAWGIYAASIVLGLVACLFMVAEARTLPITVVVRPEVFLIPGFGLVGALVAARTRNTIGWLFLTLCAAIALGTFASAYGVWAVIVDPGSLPFGPVAVAVQGVVSPFALLLLGFVVLLFPDGHLPSPRWRWVARTLVGCFAVTTLITSVLADRIAIVDAEVANPLFLDLADPVPIPTAVWIVLAVLGNLGQFAMTFASATSPFFRRRGADEITRQQLRWFAWAVGATAVTGLTAAILALLSPVLGNLFAIVAMLGMAVAVPAAVGASILRYRLWDLDVVVKRAVVYVVLLFLILGAGTFAAVVVSAAAIGGGTGEGLRDHPALLVAIGVVIGASILPLRRSARWVAQRIVYGRRATPYEVLSTFAERVAETYATDDVLPRMAQVVATATAAGSCTVWLCLGERLIPEASWPDGVAHAPMDVDARSHPDGEFLVDVRDRDELLGALSVRMTASEPMDPGKERLIRDVAGQAGLVLRNVRLIEELKASRRRIVAAQDERARKLERDIHDGAQQQLVALAVKQRLAAGLIGKDDERLRAMLVDLVDDTTDALENLRDLARGIYPPLLADRGLPDALRAQASKAAVPTHVEADGIGRYPSDVESAVYFSCLEALQNVAKYAGASSAVITLEAHDDSISFAVTDDGRGFDAGRTGYGTGLQGIEDRLASLGGTLEVTSAPGRGTTIAGRLPSGGHIDHAG